MTALLPYVGRLIALGVAWIVVHFGIQLTDVQQQQLVENIVNIVTIFVAVYFTGHKTVDKWLNPGDTASGHLGQEQKIQTKRIRNLRK